mmetsp:Transcript_8253/g.20315  ORF Transcript_8253/g.20315 Transcript_8253/m.20315 type:complete len:205 (-) Transcript_8253:178-792(-)
MTSPTCNPRGNNSTWRPSERTGCSAMAPVCNTSLPKAERGTTMLKNNARMATKKSAHSKTRCPCFVKSSWRLVRSCSPPNNTSTTKRRNHSKNKYREVTTSLGDRVVTYCPRELRKRQWAFVSEMAETTFQVANVASIPEMVTQILRSKKKPIQNGRHRLMLNSQIFKVCRSCTSFGDDPKKTLISVARSRDNNTIREEYCDEI